MWMEEATGNKIVFQVVSLLEKLQEMGCDINLKSKLAI